MQSQVDTRCFQAGREQVFKRLRNSRCAWKLLKTGTVAYYGKFPDQEEDTRAEMVALQYLDQFDWEYVMLMWNMENRAKLSAVEFCHKATSLIEQYWQECDEPMRRRKEENLAELSRLALFPLSDCPTDLYDVYDSLP